MKDVMNLVGRMNIGKNIKRNRSLKLVLSAIAIFMIITPFISQLIIADDFDTKTRFGRIPIFSIAKDSFSLYLSPTASINAVLINDNSDKLQLFPASKLDLEKNKDDLVAFSLNIASLLKSDEKFVIMFSVDKNSRGKLSPTKDLVKAGFKYNANEQAQKYQAAGDAFISTHVFDYSGSIYPQIFPGNHFLCVSNFDEGGRDFFNKKVQKIIYQPTSGEKLMPFITDDIDAISIIPNEHRNNLLSNPIYFIATSKPKYNDRDIYVLKQNDEISCYASFKELGLTENDRIDGLVIFDRDYNCIFSNGDQVLISLTSESPSLDKDGSSADIYSIRFSDKADLIMDLFVDAEELGLDKYDNINALTVIGIGEKPFDFFSFVKEWGI